MSKHIIVNDVWETKDGAEYVKKCMNEAFPKDCLTWDVEILDAGEIREKLFCELRQDTEQYGMFDLILCLTTGGVRFFYTPELKEYGNLIEGLSYSTTHSPHEETVAKSLRNYLEKVEDINCPRILILDGEIGIWGCTEQKFYKLNKAIKLWSGYYDKKSIEIQGGCGVVVKGHLDKNIINFCAFPEYGDSVSRLSEDLVGMKERDVGTQLDSYIKLSEKMAERSLYTGTLPI